jgi:hypothetical protein
MNESWACGKTDLPRVLQLYPALLGMKSQMEQVAAFCEPGVGPETLSVSFDPFPLF